MLTDMDGWVANDSDLSSPPDSDDGGENPKKSKCGLFLTYLISDFFNDLRVAQINIKY